jgi:ribosomal protein S18 acetylase RimI-like enzyme
MSQESVLLREPNKDDINFIFSSWLKSFRSSNFAKNVTNTIYFDQHHKVIESLLQNSKIIVACNRDDKKQIIGYMVATKINDILTIHYAYVKHPYRRLGVGKLLLSAFDHDPTEVSCYTHDTHMSNKLAAKFNLIYQPYLMIISLAKGSLDDKKDSKDL